MLELLGKLKGGILDILLPKFCVGCGREGLYICKACEVFLSEVPLSKEVMAVWEYEGLMEKLIYKIKFDGCYHIIDELVEKALVRVELKLPEDTVITYVPMWPKKERQRGFNQSEFIARKIGDVHSRGVHGLLEKAKDNRSQVGLGPKEREENVKGVFKYLPRGFNSMEARNVLLVDDVYTTGATMRECTKVLKRAGAKNVWCFAIARKLRL